MEKQIIIAVHAAPKTQPGGVQGALSSCAYQSDVTPLLVNKLPSANAAKLSAKKIINRSTMISILDVPQVND